MAFFFGPIFIHPEETDHEPTKMFYKREVFLSHLEETLPMTCVIGAVLFLYFVLNRSKILFQHFVSDIFFLLWALQANVWCPPLRTTCPADPPSSQKRTSCCARVATSIQRSRWKSSRAWNVSHTLPKWWKMRHSTSGWFAEAGWPFKKLNLV